MTSVEEGCIQKRRQKLSLLFGGPNLLNSLPICTEFDMKKQIIAPGGFEEIYDLHKDGIKSSWCIIHTLASQCHFSL